jgi:hypothetical protein
MAFISTEKSVRGVVLRFFDKDISTVQFYGIHKHRKISTGGE